MAELGSFDLMQGSTPNHPFERTRRCGLLLRVNIGGGGPLNANSKDFPIASGLLFADGQTADL
jgi:hypothetical protein